MIRDFTVSERAEAAVRLLFQTLGAHQRQVASGTARILNYRLVAADGDPHQAARQATLLRLLSITESYCSARLLDLAEKQMDPGANRVRTAVWEKAANDAVGSWSTIQSLFDEWHDTTPSWEVLNGLREVRNAIAHGLGELTRRQRSKLIETAERIDLTGIRIVGTRVQIREDDLTRAAVECRDLIRAVDQQTG